MQWTERKRGRNWRRRHRLVVEMVLMLALHRERSTHVVHFPRLTIDLCPRDLLPQCRLLQGNSRQRHDRFTKHCSRGEYEFTVPLLTSRLT